MLPTHLLTPCSMVRHLSSAKCLAVKVVHLRSVSSFQVLSNKQADFLSPVPLMSTLSLHFRKPFSSGSEHFISKDNSKAAQNKPVAFTDSDQCLLFDAPGVLISQLTFAESKAMADQKKCRLVYTHRNKDGLLCFQLQALWSSKTLAASKITPATNAETSPSRNKLQKSAVKEFRIHSKVGDNDFSVKLNKMKSLLLKGKQLKVHVAASSEAKNGKTALVLIKRFTEELGDVCQIKQDFANDKETCLTLIPKETVNQSETVNQTET
ncbi:unnamed protein product [Candidula unifasciata]|uniref:Uncharacterized protein n=1 Tax=Candidula unifasciata TaxID=100452 RepID=A0A8S3ZNH8_9EUPU|nr:unnamed protein product [Candidula unifasciata]